MDKAKVPAAVVALEPVVVAAAMDQVVLVDQAVPVAVGAAMVRMETVDLAVEMDLAADEADLVAEKAPAAAVDLEVVDLAVVVLEGAVAREDRPVGQAKHKKLYPGKRTCSED